MGVPRIIALATIAALVLGGGIAAALRTPGPAQATAFITDDDGRALIQHGFSTAGSAKRSVSGLPDFTEADLDREYADMGTNFVRFLISWRAVEPRPGEYDQHYLDGVEKMVGWYADRGYHVMLDMHQDLWGIDIVPDAAVGNGAPTWATFSDGFPIGVNEQWELYYLEPGVIRAFDNFWNTTGQHPELVEHYAGAWRAVAERFADNETVVAYDLMNEPYGGTVQGPFFEAGLLTSLYQRTVRAIREVDQDTWACLEPQALGFNWGLPSGVGAVQDPRAGDPRIAYCPHLYPLPMDLGEGFSGESRALVESTIAAWRQNTLRSAEALGGVPIIRGEFGLDTTLPGALDYVAQVYSTTGSMGAGVAYWSRDDGLWGPYESDGTARNLVAALDQAYPRAVAGTPISWQSGEGSLSLTLITDPSIAAPTEVYLPRAGFPNGADASGATVTAWDPQTRIAELQIAGSGEQTVELRAR